MDADTEARPDGPGIPDRRAVPGIDRLDGELQVSCSNCNWRSPDTCRSCSKRTDFRDCPTCKHQSKHPHESPCDVCDTLDEHVQSHWEDINEHH